MINLSIVICFYNDITIRELFERFNDGTHNFATELENVIAVSNTSCDLLIEYHGITEFGDQKLEDEPFLMHLEWSDQRNV